MLRLAGEPPSARDFAASKDQEELTERRCANTEHPLCSCAATTPSLPHAVARRRPGAPPHSGRSGSLYRVSSSTRAHATWMPISHSASFGTPTTTADAHAMNAASHCASARRSTAGERPSKPSGVASLDFRQSHGQQYAHRSVLHLGNRLKGLAGMLHSNSSSRSNEQRQCGILLSDCPRVHIQNSPSMHMRGQGTNLTHHYHTPLQQAAIDSDVRRQSLQVPPQSHRSSL